MNLEKNEIKLKRGSYSFAYYTHTQTHSFTRTHAQTHEHTHKPIDVKKKVRDKSLFRQALVTDTNFKYPNFC